MKRRSSLVAGLTLAAALALAGCSVAPATTVVGADGTTSVVSTSVLTGAVAELAYADLEIAEADLSLDLVDAVETTLADGASQGGAGVSVDGDTVTITAAGSYQLSGTLSSGSLVVDAPDGVVNLVLDGVDITAASVAAINVVDADQVVVWLADGSTNVLADATGATVDESVEDAPNATLFSTSDLWIAGDGALSITARAAGGITSKDTLVIAGGVITVDAADDGLRGKDHLVITGGIVTADAGGDALRSDDESVTEDPAAAVGVIWIDGGTLDLTAGSDAVDAVRQVTVLGGDLTIAAGDDGLHADDVLRIAGGTVTITESFEGLEGAYMNLSGGDVSVVSTDDGINVSGGVEALTATAQGTAAGGGRPAGAPPAGGRPGGQAGTTAPVEDLESLTVSAMEGSGFGGPAEGDNGTRFLELSGGTYVIDTTSDGVDVNGTMAMTGGTLVVSATDDASQGAMDVDGAFTISGGTLAASGMATMAVAPGEGSTQATLALTFDATVPAGTLITVTAGDGEQVAAFTTWKASQSFILSSEVLVAGAEYTISVGGEATGTSIGRLMVDGTSTGVQAIGTVAAS
jgi:hypothetical protein